MARVTGIGGIFFKSKDPAALRQWYVDNLGFPPDTEGHPSAVFPLGPDVESDPQAYAVWGPFSADTDYFDPSDKPFMINLRVDDIDAMVAELTKKGIEILGRQDDPQFGHFIWIMDPEGTKIELWQGA